MGLTAVVPRSQGFTLLELLLAVFLLGLVYALSGPLLEAGNAGLSIKSAARQLAAGFRKARSIAVTRSTTGRPRASRCAASRVADDGTSNRARPSIRASAASASAPIATRRA